MLIALLLPYGSQAAEPDASSISFIPWNGASLVLTDQGEGVLASLSGVLPDGATTLDLTALVPAPFRGPSLVDTYEIDLSLGRTNARRVTIAALVGSGDDLTTRANEITRSKAVLCPTENGPATCEPGAIVDWLRALDGTRREEVAAALGDSPETAELVRGLLASPLDEFAAGATSRALAELELATRLRFERYEAFASSSSAESRPTADFDLEVGPEYELIAPVARGGLGLLVGTHLAIVGAHERAIDPAAPDRVMVTSAPRYTADSSAVLSLAWIGSASLKLPTTDAAAPTAFFPVVEAGVELDDFLSDGDSVDLRSPLISGKLAFSMRPKSAGPGLGVGVTGQVVDGVLDLLPIAFVSAELPNLTTSRLERRD